MAASSHPAEARAFRQGGRAETAVFLAYAAMS
jgi:hypothetical protein